MKLRTGTRGGFTLVEMLVGMAILAVLMLAFTQIFGSSLRASAEVNARNELVYEGQIAQQLIASRLQSAYHVYTGTNGDPNPMQLTVQGATTRNTVGGLGQNWRVGQDPFIAMLLPPTENGVCSDGNEDACFTFYAYYPTQRGFLIDNVRRSAPPEDPNNADAWVLMEYKAFIYDGVNRTASLLASPPLPGTTYGGDYFGGRRGVMLADYLEPLGAAPYNQMFVIDAATKSVDVNLRFRQNRGGRALTAPPGTAPLTTRVFPRNWTQ